MQSTPGLRTIAGRSKTNKNSQTSNVPQSANLGRFGPQLARLSLMKAKITITLKNGVLDPQGKAIEGALHGLGFDDAQQVRQGKVIELSVDENDETAARAKVEAMCQKLLANPVMENYVIDLTP